MSEVSGQNYYMNVEYESGVRRSAEFDRSGLGVRPALCLADPAIADAKLPSSKGRRTTRRRDFPPLAFSTVVQRTSVSGPISRPIPPTGATLRSDPAPPPGSRIGQHPPSSDRDRLRRAGTASRHGYRVRRIPGCSGRDRQVPRAFRTRTHSDRLDVPDPVLPPGFAPRPSPSRGAPSPRIHRERGGLGRIGREVRHEDRNR